MTPPPATISGRRLARISAAASAIAASSGSGRPTCHTRLAKNASGKSYASACTSCGKARVTAPGLGLVHEHPHRLQRGRDHLLGSPDPVEVARDGAEAVVDRHVARPRHLQLLKHRVRPVRGEDVAGQQQDREPVHRRERGPGDHVRRAGPDRRRAHERAEPVAHPRVTGGRVHHRLLVPALVVGQELGALVERLADAADVAVAEDAEAAAEEAVLDAVPLDMLHREKAQEGLCRRQPDPRHGWESSAVMPSSSCWSSVSSRPPAIRRTSSSLSISDFAKLPRLRPRFRITKRSPTG